jgi:hypothetical protein
MKKILIAAAVILAFLVYAPGPTSNAVQDVGAGVRGIVCKQ